MKPNLLLLVCPLCVCLFAPEPLSAAITDDVGEWEGTGTIFEVSGKDAGAFSVSLTRKAIGPTKIRTDGKVVFAAGQAIPFWQEIQGRSPNTFDLASNHGSGGGRCFANGMCRTHEESPDGRAFSTTIASDGKDKVRILVTELERGKAVRFVQQTLLKKP